MRINAIIGLCFWVIIGYGMIKGFNYLFDTTRVTKEMANENIRTRLGDTQQASPVGIPQHRKEPCERMREALDESCEPSQAE